ncbi:hypothetical protein [Methanobrevibacter millerae]|uniref:Uncharacterized protein n=1 Tax=Methanobrevibacter millerae TaxID=230361 RepID=A0A0U2SJ60_9EURY|nr:hypothetical protein [Methanobrevibacter millerae]ALT68981.1 hypothetical protein sm9_1199 [Methanobrevibacter millerae]
MAFDEPRFSGKNIRPHEYLPIRIPKSKQNKKPKPLDSNMKICPNCNKKQHKNNEKCERCGLDFNIGKKIIRIITTQCSNDDKILVISSNEEKLEILKNLFKENKLENYLRILHEGNCEELSEDNISNALYDEIPILIDINKLLNLYYDIPLFNNIYSSRYLKNLHILRNSDVTYIEYDDLNELNEFIKAFQEYIYLIKSAHIEYNNISDLNKIIDKLILIKNDVCRFNENINLLYNFYKLNGITISNSLNKNIELIDDVKILFNNPCIIEKETEIKDFLNNLHEYNEINKKSKDSSYYINSFISKNRFLKEIIQRYNNYLSKYTLNIEILNAKKEFEDYGFILYNLIEFENFKEIMSSFDNPKVVNDENYFLLNEKLEEYIEYNENNFSDNFNKYRKKLEKNIKKKIKERQKKISKDNDEISELFYLLNKKLNQISINIDTFQGFKDNINNINCLVKYPKIIENDDLYNALDILNNYKNKYVDLTFEEYFNKNYEKLCEIFNIFLIKINKEYSIKKYNKIKKNTSEIQSLFKELKINIHSIKDMSNDLKKYNKIFSHNNKKAQKFKRLKSLIQSSLARLNINSMQNMSVKELLDCSNDKINKFDEIISLKNDILKIINESQNTDEKFDYSSFLIKKCYDLKNELHMDEYKKDIDDISYNNRYFKEINNYMDIFNIDETISKLFKKHEYDVNFTSSYHNKLFDENTINSIESVDIEKEIVELNIISEKLDYLLEQKNQNVLKYKNLSDFSSKYYNTNYFYKNIIEKVKECDIHNFNEVIDDLKNELLFKSNDYKINKIIYNMSAIEEIINLSHMLELEEAENLFNYEYDEVIIFQQQIKKDIEFTEYYNKEIFNNNIFKFYQSSNYVEDLNNLDLKLSEIKEYIKKNNINNSIFNNSELININKLIGIKEIIDKTLYLFEKEPDDKTEKIENIKTIIDNLFKLCENYPISDENDKYIEELISAQDKVKRYSKMNIYENKIDYHKELIHNNLQNIWKGYSTNINKIKDKLDLDLKFTKLYNRKIFNMETIQNINNLSKSDLKKLNKIQSNLTSFPDIFKNNLSNEEILSSSKKLILEIDKLDKSNINEETIKIFSNINQTLKSDEVENLIKILDIKINKPNFFNSMIELEEKLNKYYPNKYKYSEDSLNRLNNDITYSQLKNLGIITDNNEMLIRDDFENFYKILSQFEEYRMLILERIMDTEEVELTENFDIILSEKWLFLINENTIQNKLSKQFVNQFDKFLVLHDADKSKIQNVLRKTDRLYKIMG